MRISSDQTPLSIICNTALSKSTNAIARKLIVKSLLNLLNFADEKQMEVPEGLDLVNVSRIKGNLFIFFVFYGF